MKILWRWLFATALGIGCLSVLNDGSASAETLHIQGSSGLSNEVIGPHQARIETLAAHKLSLVPNTSGQALLALLQGEADLAMVSASLESMIVALRESRPDLPFDRLRSFRVIEARVAYPVHPSNPVRYMPVAKLRQILSGQIDNWREVGGPDLPIHVVTLRGGGAKRTTETMLFGGQPLTPRSEIIVERAEEVVQTVAQEPGALGITRQRLAKAHQLPQLQTKAPVARWYSLITLDEPTDAMRAVIAATRRVAFDEEP